MNRTATTTARSWRDIPQEIAPRAMSRVGRRRLTFRTARNIATAVALLGVAAGGFEIWRTWQQTPELLAAPVDSQPVRTIAVQSDGVLDQTWVERVLALPPGISLMELDLYALRTRLTASGQVASATLTREFPDTLRVVLSERSPVVRLKAQLGGDSPRDFLVARDGTVFLGEGFASSTTDSLPWLGGVRLTRQGTGFRPLEGLDRVAELLTVTMANAPRLYAGWRVVSLERLRTDGEIAVQAADVGEIVFGTREDFYPQLARLDLILEQTAARPDQPLRKVNLAVGPSQVPVSFDKPIGLTAGLQPSDHRTTTFPTFNRPARPREF